MKFRVAKKVLSRRNYWMQHRISTIDKAHARFERYLSTHISNGLELMINLTEVNKIVFTKKNRHYLLLRAIMGKPFANALFGEDAPSELHKVATSPQESI